MNRRAFLGVLGGAAAAPFVATPPATFIAVVPGFEHVPIHHGNLRGYDQYEFAPNFDSDFTYGSQHHDLR